MGIMILLAAFVVILLLVAMSTIGGGWAHIGTLFDLPSMLCVLMVTVGCVFICGYRRFLAGLPAILRRPTQSQPDVADCYQKLAGYTLACGAILAITLSVLSVYPLGDQELRRQMLTMAIYVFLYSGWLALLFFVPIASRQSDGNTAEGDSGGKLLRFLVGPAVVGFCLLPVVLTGAWINWQLPGTSPGVELLQVYTPFHIWLLFDVTSLLLVLATITALRLGMGRLQNRFNWIPICILVGVLWTLQGVAMMLSDLNPETFFPGYAVALLTTLYAGIYAIAVLVNRAWFFTTVGAIFAICYIVFWGVINMSNILAEPTMFAVGIVTMVVVIMVAVCCALGRFCDIFYLSVTRYESFSGLFKKHKIEWIVLGATPLVLIALYIAMAWSFNQSRQTVANAQCVSNLEQIGIALRNYHEQHGAFPPAYTVDAEGNPLHSWRTLILPYFDPDAIEPKWRNIYEQIRFDEPWDSEHNRQFYGPDNMPGVYGCPLCCAGATTGETMYKMIVGDNAIGRGAIGSVHGTPLSEITRPLEEVAVVVESGIQVMWMKPSDFPADGFQSAVFANDREKHEIRMAHTMVRYQDPSANTELAKRQILGGEHRRELHILFADGTVKVYLDWKLPLSDIEAMSRVRE